MGVVRMILSLILTAFQFVGSFIIPGDSFDYISESFTGTDTACYSERYYKLSETRENNTDSWRNGMVSGNGLQGVITSGAPYSDSLIYQNIHFIMPNKKVRYCPDTSDELETVKQNIADSKDIVDDASYDDVYSFHPGGALRIKQSWQPTTKYYRYTNYETAEVGVKYTNFGGTWERVSFTSQTDNATITKISESSNGKKVNLTLSFDNISTFANFENGSEVDLKYKKLVSENLDTISFIAHYPEYEESELKNGAYATVVYVITEGGTKEKVALKDVKDTQYCGTENEGLKITDADNVYLIAISERTYNAGTVKEFIKATDYELINIVTEKAKKIEKKYSKDGNFSYESSIKEHSKIFADEYNKVTINLGEDDSTLSNEKLIFNQITKKKINNDLAERAYYSGRYAYLCCSGYSTSRLGGMWTGEWAPGWGSKYTMDANVNLQTSSLNTSNMTSSYIGYATFLLRQMPDWEENAKATHGFRDAIQAPVNTDGDKAVITETCYPYPFRYWNAGASWMLNPLYETLLSYGDVKIPITDEFDLNNLKSVLSLTEEDLTDEDIKALEEKGYLDLRSEILLPLLIKSANYWDQIMTPEYYTDKNGEVHYEKGKKELLEGETYAILPSYSPENNPENYPSPSVANSAIDISACKDNLLMLIEIMKSVDENADASYWEEFLSKLPPYLYDETGALKEWAANEFTENNLHRHLSHLYCAWPMFETQDDEALKKACDQAILNRASENQASHALVHRALIGARLKDSVAVEDSLVNLMNHGIYYDSLLTNHDYDRNSCYCTDFAIGYLGIINESLVYSYNSEIELLPALPESFETGEICGIRTRNRCVIESLKWDINTSTVTVTIHSETAQILDISCKFSEETKTTEFKENETKTVEFKF